MPIEVSLEKLTATECYSSVAILGQWADICSREFDSIARIVLYSRDEYKGEVTLSGHFGNYEVINGALVLNFVFDMTLCQNGIVSDDFIAHEIGHWVVASHGFPFQRQELVSSDLDRLGAALFQFTHHFPVYRLQNAVGGNVESMADLLCAKYIDEFGDKEESDSKIWQSVKALYFADALYHASPADAEALMNMITDKHPLTHQRLMEIRIMISDCPAHGEGQYNLYDPLENLAFKHALIQRWQIPVQCEPFDIINAIRLQIA